MSIRQGSVPGRLVAVGDSFSCGVGVGVRISVAETWVAVLAAALDLELELLAAPGLASGDVLHRQVPVATARPGEVATLLVGLNDIVRAAFEPEATCANLDAIVGELCAAYPVVLVARLHDAVAQLPLPRAMRRRYVRRIAAVNAGLDVAIAAHRRALLLDLATVPALGERCAWAVDRIHPSRYGHHMMADAALATLRKGGVAAACEARSHTAVLPEPPPTLLDEIRWFVGFGGPWLVRRLAKVVFGGSTNTERLNRGGLVDLDTGELVDPDTGEPFRGRGPSRGKQLVHR